jgi:hypothetical protein
MADPGEIITFLVLASLYLLPSIFAFGRGHQQRGTIAVINLFLGWTIIGWIVALAWAWGGLEEPRRRR